MAGTRLSRDGIEVTSETHPINETLAKTEREELAFVSGDTVKSFNITVSAKLLQVIFEMPSFSGAVVTGVFSIENSDGVEICTTAAISTTLAENTVHQLSLDPAIVLIGTNTVKVTLSTDPLSSGSCYVTLYLEGSQ